MSTIARQRPGATASWPLAPAPSQAPPPASGAPPAFASIPTRVAVSWSLSRPALSATRQLSSSNSCDPTLRWDVAADSASAWLADGTTNTPLFGYSSGDEIDIRMEDGLAHVRVLRNGSCVLVAVLRHGTDRPVLYAQTSLLSDLRLAGGRYEVLGGGIVA